MSPATPFDAKETEREKKNVYSFSRARISKIVTLCLLTVIAACMFSTFTQRFEAPSPVHEPNGNQRFTDALHQSIFPLTVALMHSGTVDIPSRVSHSPHHHRAQNVDADTSGSGVDVVAYVVPRHSVSSFSSIPEQTIHPSHRHHTHIVHSNVKPSNPDFRIKIDKNTECLIPTSIQQHDDRGSPVLNAERGGSVKTTLDEYAQAIWTKNRIYREYVESILHRCYNTPFQASSSTSRGKKNGQKADHHEESAATTELASDAENAEMENLVYRIQWCPLRSFRMLMQTSPSTSRHQPLEPTRRHNTNILLDILEEKDDDYEMFKARTANLRHGESSDPSGHRKVALHLGFPERKDRSNPRPRHAQTKSSVPHEITMKVVVLHSTAAVMAAHDENIRDNTVEIQIAYEQGSECHTKNGPHASPHRHHRTIFHLRCSKPTRKNGFREHENSVNYIDNFYSWSWDVFFSETLLQTFSHLRRGRTLDASRKQAFAHEDGNVAQQHSVGRTHGLAQGGEERVATKDSEEEQCTTHVVFYTEAMCPFERAVRKELVQPIICIRKD